jgi:hypothetical protein
MTIALGVGANTAAFSMVHGVLMAFFLAKMPSARRRWCC